MGNCGNPIALFAVTIGLAFAGSVCADDNVRAVEESLRDGGFYSGEVDGAHSSELAAALARYQVRKGLPVTGQLDGDTSNALGSNANAQRSDHRCAVPARTSNGSLTFKPPAASADFIISDLSWPG